MAEGHEGSSELDRLILESGAVKRGHFRLASGRHSDVYVEKFRILERPSLLEKVCRPIADHFRQLGPSVVVGPTTGGILVAYEVARQLGLCAVYVESVDGERMLRRGGRIEPKARVLLVDDVLTTGISVREVIPLVEAAGASVIGVGVLIDRSEVRPSLGSEIFASSRFSATSYDESALPDWLAAIPVYTPGTRAALQPNPLP